MRIDFSNFENTTNEIDLDNELVNVTVMYPYGVSTSINSSNYKRQIDRLKSVLNLPQSATNYLVSNLQQELKSRSASRKKASKDKAYESYCSTLNLTSEQLGSSFRQSDSPVKLINNFSQSTDRAIKICQSAKEHHKTNKNKKQIKCQPDKDYSFCLKWQPKKTKHKCVKQLPSHLVKVSQQLKHCTHNPQVLDKKTRTFKSGTVFNHLHNDFYLQQYKMSEKKRKFTQKDNLVRKNHHIAQKKFCSKNNKKLLKNYVPYMQRYAQEVEKIATKRQKQLKDYQYDWKTGQKLFYPRLNLSKNSFQRLNRSLSISKSRQKSIQNIEVQKEKENKNYSPSQKCHLKTNTGKQTAISSLCKSHSLVQTVQTQMFQRIADIFFKQSKSNSIDLANRSIAQLSQLSHGQFQVLYPFLISLQQQQNLSKPLFVNLISKFYHNLTLYDQNTLRQQFHRTKKREKKAKKGPDSETFNLTYHPLLCNLSRSLSKEKDIHFQKVWYI